MNTIIHALRRVYARKHYALFSLAVAAMAAALLYASTSIAGQSITSWSYSTPWHVQFLVVFVSLMLGMAAAVQLYSWRHLSHGKKRHSATTAGAFGSALVATACCSPLLLPLVSLAGVGGSFIFFFHQYQLPITLVSSALLAVALYYSCRVVDCEECRVKLGKAKKDEKIE